jgi:hypothetical protein
MVKGDAASGGALVALSAILPGRPGADEPRRSAIGVAEVLFSTHPSKSRKKSVGIASNTSTAAAALFETRRASQRISEDDDDDLATPIVLPGAWIWQTATTEDALMLPPPFLDESSTKESFEGHYRFSSSFVAIDADIL